MQCSSGHVPEHVTTTKPGVSYCAITFNAERETSYHLSISHRLNLKLYSTCKQNGFRDQCRAADLNATRDAATRARLVAL